MYQPSSFVSPCPRRGNVEASSLMTCNARIEKFRRRHKAIDAAAITCNWQSFPCMKEGSPTMLWESTSPEAHIAEIIPKYKECLGRENKWYVSVIILISIQRREMAYFSGRHEASSTQCAPARRVFSRYTIVPIDELSCTAVSTETRKSTSRAIQCRISRLPIADASSPRVANEAARRAISQY